MDYLRYAMPTVRGEWKRMDAPAGKAAGARKDANFASLMIDQASAEVGAFASSVLSLVLDAFYDAASPSAWAR